VRHGPEGSVVARPVPPALAAAWLVLFGVAACVPQPAGRVTPSANPGGTGAARSPEETVSPAPATAGPSPTISFGRPTATPLPSFFAYRVRTGDTMTSIARQFRTTARSIGYWNRETYPSLDPDSSGYDPNTIRVGWTLQIIPGAEVDEQELTPRPS
jgi:hypothetical protein